MLSKSNNDIIYLASIYFIYLKLKSKRNFLMALRVEMLAVFEEEVEIVLRVGCNRFLGENTRTICILYLYVDSL